MFKQPNTGWEKGKADRYLMDQTENTEDWTNEMAQPMKVTPTDDLSYIPGIHMMERKN